MTGEELKNRLKVLNISPTQLAKSLDISKQTLNNRFKSIDVGVGFVKTIARAVNKNVYDIIDEPIIEKMKNNIIKPIPLVTIEAVAGFGNTDFAISNADILGYYSVPEFKGADFMIPVKGDSMETNYFAGDILGCKILRSKSFLQWNKAHVLATKEQGTIFKRLLAGKSHNTYTLKSDNEKYPAFEIPFEEITGIAIVLGFVRLE